MCEGMVTSGRMGHESPLVCTNTYRTGAASPSRWASLLRCLHNAPVPDIARLLEGPAPLGDRSQPGLLFADGAQRHQRLPLGRVGVSTAKVAPAKDCAAHLRCGEGRALTSHPTSKS